MGVDLTLLPLIAKDFWCAHDILRIERRRELWESIMALSSAPVPKPLGCYFAHTNESDTCYGDITEDPYGEKLRWTTPKALLTLKDHEAVQDDWKNIAVWTYLAQMPDEWPIVLYWH